MLDQRGDHARIEILGGLHEGGVERLYPPTLWAMIQGTEYSRLTGYRYIVRWIFMEALAAISIRILLL